MPFPAEERKKYINTIKDNPSKKVATIQLYYKDDPRFKADVYELDLNYLIFNQFNDRIAVEVKTDEAMSPGGEPPEYTDALEKKIMEYLWQLNIKKNQDTQDDLELRGQLEPGVVTSDGVIVNGNRRAMLLKRGNKTFFRAAILPDEFAGNIEWIRRLETQLQFNIDRQLEYEPLAKYLKVKMLRESKVDFTEIAKMMKESEPEIKKWYGIMMLMDEYLETIGAPGVYTLLRKKSGSKEEAFIQAYTQISQISNSKVKVDWAYDPVKDMRKYKQVMFDLIRSECVDNPTTYRLVGAQGSNGGTNGKGIFADKELFEQFYAKNKSVVESVTDNLPDLDEYREMPECAHFKDSLPDLSLRREEDWKSSVSELLSANLKEFIGKRAAKVEKYAPSVRLDQALTALKGISNEDMMDDDFVQSEICQNQAREISKIIEKLKRNMGL